MGSFMSSVFSLLLGWVRSLVAAMWHFFNDADGASALEWIRSSWIGIAVLLCVVCTLIDWIVHLIRWQPYKVWGSFFRRLRRHKETDYTEGTDAALQSTDYPSEPVMPQVSYQSAAPTSVVPAAPQVPYAPPAAPQPVYNQPAYPAPSPDYAAYANQPADPADVPYQPVPEQPEPSFAPVETPSSRLRRRMANLPLGLQLTQADEEMNIRYTPAQPDVKKEDAYHAPVYPSSWRDPDATKNSPYSTNGGT